VIRKARPDDVPALAALAVVAYDRYVPRIGRPPAPMTVDYSAIVDDTWVWEADGSVVGLLVLVPHEDHLLLENIAVDPAHQGSGIGGALMGFAESRARELGLPEVRLYTNEKMTENLAYYPRRGYRETRRATVHGFRRVFFTKRLTNGVDGAPTGG
jgi:N-acetylglutamate synthase-like GNAT family acetyltransferase